MEKLGAMKLGKQGNTKKKTQKIPKLLRTPLWRLPRHELENPVGIDERSNSSYAGTAIRMYHEK